MPRHKSEDNIYKGLYLAVLGIPFNVEILQKIYIKRLKLN
jgi:hypothetical protein